ncbi:MAG: UvrD-helicase domain-containing protein [candidate division KSB1 bacterium]|nr:UvrD-helicase domain-containing protein [candidate division KSB1 bacterium]
MQILRDLNPAQRQAVENIDGPNLILAGAGSGKTRVLTYKIIYLIHKKKVSPENILAMTFTNKAANEMKSRVESHLKATANGLWIGTFHSLFARILRRNCERLGYKSNFVIYDETDQLSLIKSVIADLGLSSSPQISPALIRSKIKFLKNSNIRAEEFKPLQENVFDELIYQIYRTYQERLLQSNAMDFEDLLMRSIDLFTFFPSVLQFYQQQFKYILVDEFQDTNRLQYELLKMLAKAHQNISVVGDDDQSIYRWRGAEIRNILDFKDDFKNCSIFKLEQNYRSTSNILKVAYSIISHNQNRLEKQLWTDKEIGDRVTLILTSDATDEANIIVQKIKDEIKKNELSFSDFAILYRTNAQSRAFEEALKNNGINYTVVGGVRFYERKEIKDILAYLKLIVNPYDSISLKRIINYPMRGIGEATIRKLEEYSRETNKSLFEALGDIDRIDAIGNNTKESIRRFYQLIRKYNAIKDEKTLTPGELVAALVGELEIIVSLKQEGTFEAQNRIENIKEFINGINEFMANNPKSDLNHYLENIALISDVDNWDTTANSVSLLTLHSAKGLEFSVVFITGLEDGLLPLSRQLSSQEDLEEERRLFYVGITRAKKKLYLTAAANRTKFGEKSNGVLSRFIFEIDKNYIDVEDVTKEQSYLLDKLGSTKKTLSNKQKQVIFKNEPETIKIGSLVRHPRFGRGVIRAIEESTEGRKLIIIFEDVGEKKIVLKYSQLEIER